MHKNIEESGESDILVRMQYEFNKIKSKVEVDKYTQGQDTSQIGVVENLLDSYIDSYKTGVSKCDDSFSLAGDVDFYAMDNTADYLVENCTKMLDLELLRCADMKADISNRFFNVIKSTAIIFVVILVLALAFSLTLSMSITIPLKSLMSSISLVSEGDLSGEPVVIETEDELSELSQTYNTMTDNLKMLLASLKDISNDIDTSVNEVTATVQATTSDALETSEALDNIKDNFNELKDYLNTALPDSKDVHKNLDNIIKINNNIIDDVHSETATLEDITAIMIQLSEKTQDLEKAVTKFKLQ
jgi:methyl-accepting chemotaxis protein